jgi:hypothetical protein
VELVRKLWRDVVSLPVYLEINVTANCHIPAIAAA